MARYDQSGDARAFGASCLSAKIRAQADEENWSLAEHFKLHLHPDSSLPARGPNAIVVPPLPEGISLQKIYDDFFRYLLEHTMSFFGAHELDGEAIWERVVGLGGIKMVATHPCGWGEDWFGRGAPESEKPMHTVNEAEAAVHSLMFQEGMASRLKVRLAALIRALARDLKLLTG